MVSGLFKNSQNSNMGWFTYDATEDTDEDPYRGTTSPPQGGAQPESGSLIIIRLIIPQAATYMEAPEPAFRIFPTQVPCYLNPILPGKSGFLLGVKLFLLPPKILASCQLTVRLPSSDEETWCWRQGRLLQWQTQEGAWKGPGPKGHTKAPHPQCIWAPEDSTELVSAAWRAPGVWSWYTWCLTYLNVVTFPGSFLCLSGADHKARGRAGIVCLSCLSVQGCRVLLKPSGWKMSSNYKFLLLFLLPCKSSDAGFHMPICFCLRRFIQIEFEEKSRLPKHNDLSKNPLNHFGNPNKSRAWSWVACIALATKRHCLLFHLTLL